MLFLTILLVFHLHSASGEIQNDEISYMKETVLKYSDTIKSLLDSVSRLEAKGLERDRVISELKESQLQEHEQLKRLQIEMAELRRSCSISEKNHASSDFTQNRSSALSGVANTKITEQHEERGIPRKDNTGRISRHKRLLSFPTQPGTTSKPSASSPSFFVYRTQNEVKPSPHHTIIYDHVVTNNGNGYNNYSGIFTVPVAGVYVFVWSTRIYDGALSTELIVNSVPVNALFSSVPSGVAVTSSGFAVIHVNANDVVFVRTHSTLSGTTDLWSNGYGHTSFAGWVLN